jgi:hypothetical protein
VFTAWYELHPYICSFLHSPVTSSLLGPNTLLNTLFSNILSLRSSLNVSDQVSHPYKTTGQIVVLYILIFNFLDSNLEDNRFCTEWQPAFPNFNLLLISSWIEFWSVNVVPRYMNLWHRSSNYVSTEFNLLKFQNGVSSHSAVPRTQKDQSTVRYGASKRKAG